MERKRKAAEWKWFMDQQKSIALMGAKLVDLAPISGPLATNDNLQRLWLDENKIVDLSPLALALERNATLQFLSLYKNRIVDVSRLAASLALNHSLTMITLRGNNISNIEPLAASLRGNSTLETLILSDNDIGSVVRFGEALKENSTLTTLELSRNQIRDVEPLGEALDPRQGSVCGLIHLRLDQNKVTEIAPLLTGLEDNTTLTTLDYLGNDLVDVAAFSRFLQLNTTLEGLEDLRDLSALLAAERAAGTGETTARRHGGSLDPGTAEMTERQYVAHQTLILAGGRQEAGSAATAATAK